MPANLPTAPESVVFSTVQNRVEVGEELSALETIAHAQGALFSSDALRMVYEKYGRESGSVLPKIATKAKTQYPTEDGWVVLTTERLAEVMPGEDGFSQLAAEVPHSELPNSTGSLAEAIALKNIDLALTLLKNRPMVALAEAAGEYTTLLRVREGVEEPGAVSSLLYEKTSSLPLKTIRNILEAFTTAVDGTATTEKEAVERAIKKAISLIQ